MYLAADASGGVQREIEVLSLGVHVQLLLAVQSAHVDGVGDRQVDERAEEKREREREREVLIVIQGDRMDRHRHTDRHIGRYSVRFRTVQDS